MDAAVIDAAERPSAPALRRILAVFNPAAGRHRRPRFERIISELRKMGCAVAVIETQAPGHAEVIAREVSTDQFDVIAAAGGDGTINEIVNGLRGKSIGLGVIPLGTANVLADEIGLRRAPEIVARTLADGAMRPIYVGVCNGRRFVMMAGAGFDANVVNGVSLSLKKRLGPLAYVWQAAYQAFVDDFAGCEVTIDGVRHATGSVVACNGRRYGGPFIAAPQASLADNTLHTILMKGSGWLSIARYGTALLLGRISSLSDVAIIPSREVVVTGVPGRPIQADGDIIATLPARIAVDPEPVRLVFPA